MALELHGGDGRQTAIDALLQQWKSLPAGDTDSEIRCESGADTIPDVGRCGEGV
ncbi:MAG: hypothetical protein ABSD48_10760 [Armatimonadota bacterium]|jgi:hypothetical protein